MKTNTDLERSTKKATKKEREKSLSDKYSKKRGKMNDNRLIMYSKPASNWKEKKISKRKQKAK
jgi:hypothetical protein